jgi:pimeloyl-ACP methyl ester carboxylesterase
LLLIGAPMASEFFTELAELLATERTVLTYDPRGISRSTLTGPTADDTPVTRAQDVYRLIEAMGGGPVDVFGSSGGAMTGLAGAPHVAAVITNLADDLGLVDRMQDALAGEMQRRQEKLRAAGNLANVTEYERARENGAPLEPLPTLFVVVDEFSELLSQKPDFAELFVAIGRLGRSLQIHLLLASQRLEEGRLRGLDSHLSYRIGLKTEPDRWRGR